MKEVLHVNKANVKIPWQLGTKKNWRHAILKSSDFILTHFILLLLFFHFCVYVLVFFFFYAYKITYFLYFYINIHIFFFILFVSVFIRTSHLFQLISLRTLMQGDKRHSKAPLGNNFRPTQPLHHRSVRTNIDFNIQVIFYFN